MRFSLLMAALAAACVADPQQQPETGLEIDGALADEVDQSELVQAFLDSRAQFGVIVDPVTGDVVTLQNLDRASNSADFTQVSATCANCTGSCNTGPGFDRQIDVSLLRNTGNSLVDVSYTGTRNWGPVTKVCNGAACPVSVDASGGPASLDLELFGTLGSCSSFGVFFDTDDTVVTPPPTALINMIGTVDNVYEMWVDGVQLVTPSSPGASDWTQSTTSGFDLTPGPHVIAVRGTDAGPPMMFQARIVDTRDNSLLAVTDTSWKAFAGPLAAGWELPGFDDSTWPSAANCGGPTAGPWGDVVGGGVADHIWFQCFSPTVAHFRKTIVVPN